ncbi:MAG: DMT family transporter, partial [Candidatus Obscuribacterales bacterium]|nr:DMT family transporter [Candidatus Obscuribacterales bacterium]
INVLVLISVLFWGAWGIFEKKALTGSTAKDVAVLLYLFNIAQIPIFIGILSFVEPGWSLSPSVIGWSFAASLCYAFGIVAYLSVLKRIDASYVIGSTACYPIVTIFLAASFLGEPLIASRLIGALLVAGGVFAICKTGMGPNNELAASQRSFYAFCLFLTCLTFSLRSICSKLALLDATPLEVYLGKCIWDLFFIFVVVYLFRRQGHKFDLLKKRTIMFCSASTLCLALGGFACLAAMDRCSASYVVAITSCYPVVMYLLALVFLKEQFSKLRFAGISILVMGAILLQYTQSM